MRSRTGPEIEHEILILDVAIAERILVAGFYSPISAIGRDIQVHIIEQGIGYLKKQVQDLRAGIVNRKAEPVRGWGKPEIQGFRSRYGPFCLLNYLIYG